MTLTVDVVNPAGTTSDRSSVELPAEIFDVPTNIALIHPVVVAQLAAALRGALSDRARNGRVHVASALVAGDSPSTKAITASLASISTAKNILVVAERSDAVSWKSLRNLAGIHVLEPGQLNTYDVLISDDVIFTLDALETFLAGPASGRSAKGAASSAELDADSADQSVTEGDEG
jgi:ribosomal protein L4